MKSAFSLATVTQSLDDFPFKASPCAAMPTMLQRTCWASGAPCQAASRRGSTSRRGGPPRLVYLGAYLGVLFWHVGLRRPQTAVPAVKWDRPRLRLRRLYDLQELARPLDGQ